MVEDMTEPTVDQRVIDQLPRLLLVWYSVPSYLSGAQILLRRLFKSYPKDKLWALTSIQEAQVAQSHEPLIDNEHQISVKQVHIRRRFVNSLAKLINWFTLPLIVGHGLKLVREEKIEAVFTVSWDIFFAVAYFIHRLTGIPLYIYVMDDHWGGKRGSLAWLKTWFYQLIMPRALRSAKVVWVISEPMRDYFSRTYGVKSEVLLPSVDLKGFSENRSNTGNSGKEIRIVYTGAIYRMQADAVRDLIYALGNSNLSGIVQNQGISLALYSGASLRYLKKLGVDAPYVQYGGFVSIAQIPEILSKADILFLPLSFLPENAHIVQTSFPTKTAEYLASGIPTLVYAPPYSSVTQYFRQHNIGLVVDNSDVNELTNALTRLTTDLDLRKAIVENSREIAKKNHDTEMLTHQFLKWLADHKET
jgi:glycosyltransferase involved in cell wall biosynthesis